ncbi:MAG: hypothetical protein NTY16_05745, partial [Deltaproteobacteria bacterium]|nr:hypothetical protein [Deltaproteobacteria bacterium]
GLIQQIINSKIRMNRTDLFKYSEGFEKQGVFTFFLHLLLFFAMLREVFLNTADAPMKACPEGFYEKNF